MPNFHETGYGKRFFESQLPRLIEALESIASAAHAMTEATEQFRRIADRLEEIDLEAEDDAPAPALAAIAREAQRQRPLPKTAVPQQDVNAALMGINIRPLVCPECEGFLDETHDSPEEWYCPECKSHVGGVDALMASDEYYAKHRRVPDSPEMISNRLKEWENDDPITGVMREAGLLPACPKCKGKLQEPQPNRFRCPNCQEDVPIDKVASIPANPKQPDSERRRR